MVFEYPNQPAIGKTENFTSPKIAISDIQQHWLRERIELGDFRVEWVSTNDLIADGLTKPLTR